MTHMDEDPLYKGGTSFDGEPEEEDENHIEAQIVEFINAAIATEDRAEKLDMLQKAHELLFNRANSAVFLKKYFPELLSFYRDKQPQVRKYILSLMEEACERDNEFVFKVTNPLLMLYDDDNSNVVKKVLICAANIFRRALHIVSKEKSSPAPSSHQDLWSELNHLKAKAMSTITTEKNDVIRVQALKFLEIVVLTYLPVEESVQAEKLRREKEEAKRRQQNRGNRTYDNFNVENLPHTHPLFSRESVEREGEELFTFLLLQLSSQSLSSTSMIVLLSILSSVARQCPSKAQQIVSSFLNLYKSPPSSYSTPQTSSLNHALKNNFLSLLRIGTIFVKYRPIWDLLRETLEQMNVQKEIIDMIRKSFPEPSSNKRPISNDNESAEPSEKRSRTNGNDPEADYMDDGEDRRSRSYSSRSNQLTSRQSSQKSNLRNQNQDTRIPDLSLLSPDLIANIVIDAMNNLPLTPPTSMATPVNFSADNFLQRFLDTFKPQQPPTAAASSSSSVSQPSGRPDPRIRPRDPRLKSDPASEQVTSADSSAGEKFPQTQVPTAAASKQPAKPPVTLEAKPIAAPQSFSLVEQAFGRILDSESGASLGGKPELRMGLLIRLAGQQQQQEKVVQDLQQHIIGHIPDSAELLCLWLFHEYYTSILSESGQKDVSRYTAHLISVLEAVKTKLDPKDKLVIKIFIEIPYIPDEAFQVVQKYCEEEERSTVGLCILRDLILQRLPYRETSLRILLNYTSHKENFLRSAAIRLVTNILYTNPILSPKIESFANSLLASLSSENFIKEEIKVEGETEESSAEEEIKRKLLLSFALCTKQPPLLDRLVETYVTSSTAVRKTMLKQIPGVVKSIGLSSPHLLKVISSFPKGAEPFVLQILHILTEKNAPSAQLVAVVKDLFLNKLPDPRFLIPILPGMSKEEVETVLPSLVDLAGNAQKTAFLKLLSASPPPMSPAELLVSLHLLKLPPKKLVEATKQCLEQKEYYKQETLATVLQQLVDCPQIPTLYMHTVIKVIARYPALSKFVVSSILPRLISKQIWNDKILWEGFIKCCNMTEPASCPVLMSLPKASLLEEVLTTCTSLRAPLVKWCNQNSANLHKHLLQVLGLDKSSSDVDLSHSNGRDGDINEREDHRHHHNEGQFHNGDPH